MKFLKKIRFLAEYAILVVAGLLIRLLSAKQTYALGRGLGRLAFSLGVARKTSLANLAAVFPDKSEIERRSIALEAYQHFSITFLELMRMPLLDPSQPLPEFEFEGLEILDQSLARGKGAVCLSGHFGNWEWMGAALVAKGYPVSFMIGTQSNPWADRLFNQYRSHCRINLIPLKNVRGVLTALKTNQFVALLGDQDGDRWGLFVDFLGRIASTFTGPAVFARKTGADTLAAFPVRLGPARHRVKIFRLPEPPEGLDEKRDLAFRLQAYNDALAQAIRENPGQWLWMHKRWESRPEHHLQGEERRRAERGELVFDGKEQVWREAGSGSVFEPAKP
jgi:KDO2-lipid IV(A) lauroyltransferase